MIDRVRILELIPHQGAMCLLERVLAWDDKEIVCEARSHLDPSHPLRSADRLGAVSGIEYGLQAAALHGAICAGGVPQAAGRLVALRGVALHATRLDDPTFGALKITARAEISQPGGVAYSFRLLAENGGCLVEGRCLIALPSQPSSVLQRAE
jgi:predicted hotdog family 3-hydroxylacyl-ACP dehydratase